MRSELRLVKYPVGGTRNAYLQRRNARRGVHRRRLEFWVGVQAATSHRSLPMSEECGDLLGGLFGGSWILAGDEIAVHDGVGDER